MEKRGDISPESTPRDVPPADAAPPALLKKGATADDQHPTAAELRAELADGPQKRLADRAADRLKP